MQPRRVGTTRRTVVLTALALASGLIVLIAFLVSVSNTESAARQQARDVVPAEAALRATWVAAVTGQEHFVALIETQDPATRAAALNDAERNGQLQNAAWSTYRKHALDGADERALQRSYESSAARSIKFAASLLGMSLEDPQFAATLAEEASAAEESHAALEAIESTIYAPTMRRNTASIASGLEATRTAVALAYAAVALAMSTIGIALVRAARRDDRRLAAEAAAKLTESQYTKLETTLQHALEMEHEEEGTYNVIAQALAIVADDVPSEMLLADSSQAHFRQVLSVAPGADTACRVGAPEECPATKSGQTQVFQSSADLDTCPMLRGRKEAVWAMCVPVSIAGRSTGVLHMERPVDHPSGDTRRGWELIARRAGDRLALLRAFARSETQAHTDPLTGLLNRRSLDARTRDLTDQGLTFVVAYGDLDHFKLLNDVHGHDTGDRALRLFARVLRDSVRPNDIPARYGGEEFVAVLPDCSLDDAVAIIERIRARLHDALTDGNVPVFTVSFGLAASEPGLTFGETVDAADQALLRAKRNGRDRIEIAGPPQVTPSVPPTHAPRPTSPAPPNAPAPSIGSSSG